MSSMRALPHKQHLEVMFSGLDLKEGWVSASVALTPADWLLYRWCTALDDIAG